MNIFQIFSNVYFIVVFITMLYSLYLAIFKKITLKQKYFYFYMILVFICDVVGYYIRKFFEVDQFYFYFTYMVVHIIYFGYFYYLEFQNKKFKKITLVVTLLSFFAATIIQLSKKTFVFSSEIFIIFIFFNILLGLIWFLYIINNIDANSITSKQAFWVSIALIFWNVCGLLRYIPLYSLFEVDREFLRLINIIFSVVNIITYLLYLKGLKCAVYNVLRNFNYLKK